MSEDPRIERVAGYLRDVLAPPAALIDVREAIAEFGPAEATAQVMVDVAHWRQETLAATFAMALVRLAKAEAVEVTW